MTIKEYAIECCEGELDMDVCDVDIDMMVAFCYSVGDSSNAYEKFIEILANNVEMVKVNNNMPCPVLVCNFTKYYKSVADKLTDWIDNNIRKEFDEPEYNMVNATEGLVAGYFSDSQYAELVKALTE